MFVCTNPFSDLDLFYALLSFELLFLIVIDKCDLRSAVHFKLATLTHNTLCSIQPAYLHSLRNYHTPTRSLRSANTNLLSVPRVRITFASRGFSVAAPTVWNSLPSGIRDSSSNHTFRRLLKTHCSP